MREASDTLAMRYAPPKSSLAGAQPREPRRPATVSRCLGTFGLLGPAVGWLTVYLHGVFADAAVLSFGFVARSMIGLLFLSIVALPFAYVLGVVPALLSALVLWSLRRSRAVHPAVAIVLTTVAGAGAAGAAADAIIGGNPVGFGELAAWPYSWLPGATAALVCGLWVETRQ
jgi:hypothetical protein